VAGRAGLDGGAARESEGLPRPAGEPRRLTAVAAAGLDARGAAAILRTWRPVRQLWPDPRPG